MVRPLGEGGVGSVWLGVDPATGEQAALKFYLHLRASLEEFQREASTALRDRHENLVRTLDAGVLDGQTPWLALEFVDGEDLRTCLERSPLPDREAARRVMRVFSALDALHRGGFAHGDVKPENVLLATPAPDSDPSAGARVALVDFGRARLHHLSGDGGVFPGTAPYMHPSLFHGGAPTPATDCFAAWVLLHECVTGSRPFTVRQLSDAGRPANGGSGPLPTLLSLRQGAAPPILDRLIAVGLAGELADARAGWLALTRYLRGKLDVPRPLRPPPDPPPALVASALGLANSGVSVALLGDAQLGSRVLGLVHRGWAVRGKPVLWARAGWGSADQPLSGALSLASHAADGLDGAELARVAAELGPLRAALAAASPATRAWLAEPAGARDAHSNELAAALRAFCAACPRPLLIIAEGLDAMDGTSRRFLGGLALSGVVVVGSSLRSAPHGLSREILLPELELPDVDRAALSVVAADLHHRAEALGLPFGERLGRCAAQPADRVEEAALEAEAVGAAVWDGVHVVPRHTRQDEGGSGPGGEAGGEAADARRFAREAAARLDASVDPLLVARYACLGGDGERLTEVLDAAVAEALTLDPAVALELLLAAGNDDAPDRLLRTFHVAVLARDMDTASGLLSKILVEPALSEADRAEAEAEFAFRTGQIGPAIGAYRRVAAHLGRPVRFGVRGFLQDLSALWRVWRDRPAQARPDARLARVFERLHDLHFTEDHRPMLRLHALWREAAPSEPRVRAMDVVWNVALGRPERAMRVHEVLWREVPEHADPAGAAVVLLHRGIARSWGGQVADAHADVLDAAERLLRVGDPYLAALAVGSLAVCAFHLGDSGPLRRVSDKLAALVRDTGDVRAAAWVTGARAQVAWMEGRGDDALAQTRRWVQEAEARRESTSVLARRFLAELLIERGDLEEARAVLLLAAGERRRFHMQMDFTDALAIDLLVVDGRLRMGGRGGVAGLWRYRRVMATLVRRSPRWRSRALVADAWQAIAAGRPERGDALFERAHDDALRTGLHGDALWALENAAASRGSDSDAANKAGMAQDATERAALFARAHGLRMAR